MKRAVLALAVVIATACGQGSSHTLEGTMTVNNFMGTSQIVNGPCTGKQGFEDLKGGAAVGVKDESGKVLAAGQLGEGKAPDKFRCQFPFRLTDVPDADFYQVEVSHRGEVTYSRADLDKAGWKITLTLG